MSKKIVSIEIELTDYEPIRFKMAEARELYEQLHELFGEKEQHIHNHNYPYWWNQPYYTWTNASDTITMVSDYAGGTVVSDQTNMSVTYLSQ